MVIGKQPQLLEDKIKAMIVRTFYILFITVEVQAVDQILIDLHIRILTTGISSYYYDNSPSNHRDQTQQAYLLFGRSTDTGKLGSCLISV